MKKITVVGTGYVGLSLAVLLAKESEVIALEIDNDKVDLINNKISPIMDENISDFLTNKKLNLVATVDRNFALQNRDYIIIATPTNYDEITNTFDTNSVEKVIDNILEVNGTDKDVTIIIKSTIPIGFTEKMKERYQYENIIFSPEFLREGNALKDNLFPSRIVMGSSDTKAKVFANLLDESSDQPGKNTILFMQNTEAEAVKLFSNTYLALRVSFFNELDTFADHHGLNTFDIIEAVSADSRIGDFYNNPSFGYGGYCLPKDTKQLLANYENIPQNLMKAVVESNYTRKNYIAEDILNKSDGVIGIYRLTMKTGSDNFRSSAILDIIDYIESKGRDVVIYEPNSTISIEERYNVINDLTKFKKISSIVVTNRVDSQISDLEGKIYTRDVYSRD